jgi:2-amino-4-hydroxy-6-hydroxymethyldihydropteridine diphosphokinase
MTIVYLGLGSNIGDKEASINKAITMITRAGDVKRVSPLYLTEPVGDIEQEWFLNCVVEVETDKDPEALLSSLQIIEKKLGKKKTVKNGPRTMDIDILLYGNQIMNLKDLVIPHPRLHQRLFVLQPMMDLNPDFVHPVLKKTIRELSAEQPWAEMVTRYK